MKLLPHLKMAASTRGNHAAGLAEVRGRLGPPGAVDRAADAIADLLQRRQKQREVRGLVSYRCTVSAGLHPTVKGAR